MQMCQRNVLDRTLHQVPLLHNEQLTHPHEQQRIPFDLVEELSDLQLAVSARAMLLCHNRLLRLRGKRLIGVNQNMRIERH